jgi:hypothetical protein
VCPAFPSSTLKLVCQAPRGQGPYSPTPGASVSQGHRKPRQIFEDSGHSLTPSIPIYFILSLYFISSVLGNGRQDLACAASTLSLSYTPRPTQAGLHKKVTAFTFITEGPGASDITGFRCTGGIPLYISPHCFLPCYFSNP